MTIAIRHHQVRANGIDLHVAEAGAGPAVLLCHGFPECWYSWRHQIAALAAAGFRVVAPDMRGYGGSDAPPAIGDYSMFQLVGDMVGLAAALDLGRPVIVGHDWGAAVAWHAALLRPDLFRAVAGLSVPFAPRGSASPLAVARAAGWDDFYQVYFQGVGGPEADLERDPTATFRRILWSLSAGPEGAARWRGRVPAAGFVAALAEPPEARPAWITDADIAVYADAFRTHGFRGPLNWYRNIERNWAEMAPWDGARITQPALFVAGVRDGVLGFGRTAVSTLAENVPRLAGKILIEGAGHWVQQEAPAAVNTALLEFLARL